MFQEKLLEVIEKEHIWMDEPMSRHTSFRVGGPADFYVIPKEEEIPDLIALCKDAGMPYHVIGNGSNLLVGDKGIPGVVIEIGTNASNVTVEGNKIYAQAGATLARVSQEAMKAGLTGLEFASGIPGTVGGAVVMNAGAYGGEIKDVLEWALILTAEGQFKKVSSEELELSYRHSNVCETSSIVIKAAFSLKEGEITAIRGRMDELRAQRIEKQPLEYPSAGSTFKRPEGLFAGKLIQDAGLRGYRVGDAQVAEKHCGFVINRGQATAADIVQLMKDVQVAVKEQFLVDLEPEVKMIGEF